MLHEHLDLYRLALSLYCLRRIGISRGLQRARRRRRRPHTGCCDVRKLLRRLKIGGRGICWKLALRKGQSGGLLLVGLLDNELLGGSLLRGLGLLLLLGLRLVLKCGKLDLGFCLEVSGSSSVRLCCLDGNLLGGDLVLECLGLHLCSLDLGVGL